MPIIANLPEQPDGHVHCIRYIEVPRQDLYSLLVAQYPQNRVALRNATINAYAAALQEDCKGDGGADFVVFSSLLGPTVRGTFRTGRSTIRAWVLSGLGCTEPKDSQKFVVATSALERLLKLLLVVSSAIVEAQVVDNSAETTSSEPRHAPEDAMEIDSTGTDPNSINTEPLSLPVPVQAENGSLAVVGASAVALEVVKAMTRLVDCDTRLPPLTTILRAIPKRSRPSPGSDSEGYDTDASAKRRRLHSIRSEAASGSRAPKSNSMHRHTAMLSNTHIREIISPGQVVCNCCGGRIKLHKTRLYEIENFNKHVKRCSGITGVHQPKKAKNASNAPTKNVTIDAMFRRKSTSARASTSTLSLSPVVPALTVLPGSSTLPQPVQPARPVEICQHLSGPEWEEYVLRTRTRNFGGIGPTQRIVFTRQLFHYKAFPATKALPTTIPSETIPEGGNAATAERDFTETELRTLDDYCEAHARRIVDIPRKFVKAAGCSGIATGPSGLSNECAKLLKDDGLRRSVNRKKNESKLPESEQHAIHISRDKFSSTLSSAADERKLQLQLRDLLFYKLWSHLERGKSTECFIHLYQQAAEGKLKDSSTFTELCQVLLECSARKLDQYKAEAQDALPTELPQFYDAHALVRWQLVASICNHDWALIANSVDALQNPSLVLESVALS
ncbi:hypothetical protein EXIGLDRAFT_696165 [Exidia glandulosa HHB12029]|uniref:Uncharacterized protein n=1 Tax=Exidia glandulosa HHB12029 TaxID=1314781 RepID=A0A165FJB1_EXIGL|nr:hypothetical protein EXIGLDRAFT_696165 [Exidia glandulosa HHB12029]